MTFVSSHVMMIALLSLAFTVKLQSATVLAELDVSQFAKLTEPPVPKRMTLISARQGVSTVRGENKDSAKTLWAERIYQVPSIVKLPGTAKIKAQWWLYPTAPLAQKAAEEKKLTLRQDRMNPEMVKGSFSGIKVGDEVWHEPEKIDGRVITILSRLQRGLVRVEYYPGSTTDQPQGNGRRRAKNTLSNAQQIESIASTILRKVQHLRS